MRQLIEGGMGLLMGGTAGVQAAHVVILGAGTVGLSAAKVAMGMGARVTILDSNLFRLRQIDQPKNCVRDGLWPGKRDTHSHPVRARN